MPPDAQDRPAAGDPAAPIATEAQLRAVLDAMPEGCVVFDRAWRYLYVNPIGAAAVGAIARDLIGRSLFDLRPELRTAAHVHRAQRVMDTGVPDQFEIAGPRPDGTTGWFESHIHPVPDGIFILTIDRSEAHATTEALRRSEDQTAELARRLPVGLYTARLLDGSGIAFDYFSDQAGRITGVDPAAVVEDARAAFAAVHPEDAGPLLARSLEAGRTLEAFNWEGRFHVGGATRWIRLASAPSAEAGGGVVFHGIIEDVTGRRLAEQALRERELDLAEAQRIAHVGSWSWDPATDKSTWSDEFRAIAGRPPGAEAPGLEDSAAFYTASSLALLGPAIERALSEGTPYELDLEVVRLDGTLRTIVARGERVQAPDGHHVLRGTVADVTEQRQAQEREALARRDVLIGQLAAGVAHDFNNLLAAIAGGAELLRDEVPDDSPLLEDVDVIREAAGRAAALTRRLLAYGRGQMLNLGEIDAEELLRGLLPLARSVCGESVSVSVRWPEAPLTLTADRAVAEQALLSLVINARDAMPDGGQLEFAVDRVVIEPGDPALRPPAKPGGFVRIRVSDTGAGIDPEVLPRIFEPFFNAKDLVTGTGLGLASVEGAAAQSRGMVTAESTPGSGSTFALLLPEAAAPGQAAARPARLAADGPTGRTVLLVEDENIVRQAIARLLRSAGYDVLDLDRPAVALALAEEGSTAFDLLLTDVQMPGMTGPELAARIRELRPGLPVVFMSAYAPERAFPGGRTPEDAMFLEKPFSAVALAGKVREALGD